MGLFDQVKAQPLPGQGFPPPGMLPPPQPTPPGAGFNAWKVDPMNAAKILPSLTAPNMPVAPQPQAPPMAGDPNAQRPAFMSPPQVQPPAFMNPPQTFGSRNAQQSPPLEKPSMGEPLQMRKPAFMTPPDGPAANPPQVSSPLIPPSMPNLPPSAGAPAQFGPMAKDAADLQRLQQTGSGISQIKNPWLRGLARVGDIAGQIIAPGIDSVLPGTEYHHQLLMDRARNNIGSDQGMLKDAATLQDTNSQVNQRNAMADKSTAQAAAIPINAGLAQQKANAQLTQHGLRASVDGDGNPAKDAQGNPVYEADPNSPAYQKQQTAQKVSESLMAKNEADTELKSAETELAKSKNNPNSPAYQMASQKLAVARQNASAASVRAAAYMGNYRMHAQGVDLQGNALNGATTLNGKTVGTSLQGQVTSTLPKIAAFGDVYGSLDNLDGAAERLTKKGGALNDPAIAAALADPASTSTQWLQGQVANSSLSPEQRDYVIANKQMQENIQALRKSVGGGVSDSQMNRLVQLVPNASTPDIDYLHRQTQAVRQQADRLGAGLPGINGGASVDQIKQSGARPAPGGGFAPKAPGSAMANPPSAVPQDILDAAKEGQYIHGPNGTSFVKTNGKAVAVKK